LLRGACGVTAAAILGNGPARATPGPGQSFLTAPDGRRFPVWEWRSSHAHAGTILFSHGAQSSPLHYPDMIGAWVAAGWNVIAPLHVDSTEHPDHARHTGAHWWKVRIEDVRAVARQIGGAYVAAGHSFGGLNALTLGGAAATLPAGVTGPLRDPAARAVLAFSPPRPVAGMITAPGYAELAVPALIQTGTIDLTIPGAPADSWKGHLTAFDVAAPGGHRYALVLDGADHYFGGLICDPTRPGPPQTAQLANATALSLAFLAEWGTGHARGTAPDQRVGVHHGYALSVK